MTAYQPGPANSFQNCTTVYGHRYNSPQNTIPLGTRMPKRELHTNVFEAIAIALMVTGMTATLIAAAAPDGWIPVVAVLLATVTTIGAYIVVCVLTHRIRSLELAHYLATGERL